MSKRKTGWIPMFSPLAHRGYRHLFIAQVAALLGTGLATIALGLLAHRLAGANAGEVLAMVLSIKMVAYIGVAPFASAIAARLPRKTLLVLLDLVRAGGRGRPAFRRRGLAGLCLDDDALCRVGGLHTRLPGHDPRSSGR